MNKHIRNTILILCLFVTMSFVTFSYAAYSSDLMITGGEAIIYPMPRRDLVNYIQGLVGNGEVEELGGAIRYTGTSPNNYVHYNGETWRIIGVFNVQTDNGTKTLTKIIKDEPVEILSYNSDWYINGQNGKNDFTNSTILNYLYNNYYYKSYDEWNSFTCINGPSMQQFNCDFKGLSLNSASMVEKVYWNLGSTNPYTIGVDNVFTPAFLMQSENSSAAPNVCTPNWDDGSRCTEQDSRNSSILTYVGLPYGSDITYASGSVCSEYTIGSSCYESAWTSKEGPEWTINPAYSTQYADTVVSMYKGHIFSEPASNAYGIRPTVYLKNIVNYAGGTGTISDPILLSYNGAIGIETGLVNYAPEGDPVNDPKPPTPDPDVPDTPDTPENPDDPNDPIDDSDDVTSLVNVTATVEEISYYKNHYFFGFSIENNTGADLNEWTITLTINPNVQLDVSESRLSSQFIGEITTDHIKINNQNKYYAPNAYAIKNGETYDTSYYNASDGILALSFDPNVVSINDIFTDIKVSKKAETFE